MLPTPGLACALLAFGSSGYGALRGNAEPIQNLGRFLERYIGDCDSDDPSFDKKSCEANAAAQQKKYADKVLLIELDDVEEQLHFAEWEARNSAYRLHLTPFFAERNLALSVGKPDRLSKEGHPVVKNIPIWVKPPDGKEDFAFRRQLERGMVRLELLVKPRKVWRLKRKDGDGDYRGVEGALVGLRVYEAQGQNVLAEQTY